MAAGLVGGFLALASKQKTLEVCISVLLAACILVINTEFSNLTECMVSQSPWFKLLVDVNLPPNVCYIFLNDQKSKIFYEVDTCHFKISPD